MSTRERYTLPIAVFMILKQGDDFLMIQRGQTGWLDGFWSLPAGGLEVGETIKDAAIRETKEEVGVDVLDAQLVHCCHCSMHDQQWISMFFLTEHRMGNPRICEPEKHNELNRVSLEMLPEEIVPYVKQALEQIFLKQCNYSQFGY